MLSWSNVQIFTRGSVEIVAMLITLLVGTVHLGGQEQVEAGGDTNGYASLIQNVYNQVSQQTPDSAIHQEYMNRWHKNDAKMGVKNSACDDGESNLDVDWPSFSVKQYNCTALGLSQWATPEHITESTVDCRPHDGAYDPRNHKCMSERVIYADAIPRSGNHRPLWPKYGEYLYVPPQRWMHNLEHGAVVFLYHPCASSSDVATIRSLLTSCLRRHIITPHNKLTPDAPLALVTWGCRLVMSHADTEAATQFIKTHALHGGEDVPRDGQYTLGHVRQAAVVPGSDFRDAKLCPTTTNRLTPNRDIDMKRSRNLMFP